MGSTDDNSGLPIHMLHHIFNREFWQRVWIIQEISLARRLVLVCGAKLCGWPELVVACKFLYHVGFSYLRPTRNDGSTSHRQFDDTFLTLPPAFTQLQTRAGFGTFAVNKSLRELLLESISSGLNIRALRASDPRDMIYAFLSLYNDSKRLGIYADYSKPCESLYVQVAEALLSAGNLGVMSRCHFPKRHGGLPSWAPDWSRLSQGTSIEFSHGRDDEKSFRASGVSQNPVELSISGDSSPRLSVSGTLVGTICKKGKDHVFPAMFLPIQQCRDFIAELENLFHQRDGQSNDHVNHEDIWRIPIINREWHYERQVDAWVYQEATSVSYDSYCAIHGYRNPPEDCPDAEKWHIKAGTIYLDRFRHTIGRRPFLTENGYLGMGPDYL